MATITTVLSSAFDSVKRRIVKVRRFGKNDIQTAKQAVAYGMDSNPIAGMKAIFADTANRKEQVIIGYINVDQLALPGETRMFSTDDEGELQMFLWLKKDGTLWMGGNADNAVRYAPLNTGLQNLVTALQTELGKIAIGVAGGGGSYTPGTLSVDITASKINEIKTL